MSTKVIDCVAIANEMKEELIGEIKKLKSKGVTVGIATVLVGNDFGARMYRGQVEKFCQEMNVQYISANPSEDSSEDCSIWIFAGFDIIEETRASLQEGHDLYGSVLFAVP